ncbi:ABC transporter permease [Mycoplasma sp. SG1]|uniref:ABC transporter permease n=1 Tax=Mycoplasma sp. SG1 TaxID=2810348 RepID=UPI0020253129|nr:ABC transporter permease [Mycoplasma sp. SG1]URM52980.1 ABC transporter permease [Mycoplasma sp. SG1]
MRIQEINQNVKYSVVAISPDVGFPRFYTTSQFATALLFGNKENILNLAKNQIDKDYFMSFFGYYPTKANNSNYAYKPYSSYYNAKLTTDTSPNDLSTYNVNQPYNDYSQFGLNGGKVQFGNKKIVNFTQNGKSIISSLFSWDIVHNSFWKVITSIIYLIILIVVISLFLGLIIMAITTNSIMIESRKQIVLLKAFGYNDKEILKTSAGYYIFLVIIAFVLSCFLTIFLSQYLFYVFFASKNLYIPFSFQWWVLIVGFILLLVIYYVNKLIAWKINKTFVPAEAVKE